LSKKAGEHKIFTTLARAIKPSRKDPEGSNQVALFECQELECFFEFSNSEGLQDHIHFGQHDKTATSEGLYERRDWR